MVGTLVIWHAMCRLSIKVLYITWLCSCEEKVQVYEYGQKFYYRLVLHISRYLKLKFCDINFQIMVIIVIEESNDHNPIFTMQQYTAEIVEHDSIRNLNGVPPGASVGLVIATDQDGISSPAGQIEYQIVSGHILNSVQIFNITNPAVRFESTYTIT